MDTARHIVATLLHRKRFARKMLRRAGRESWPDPAVSQCQAQYTEAHNAEEVARRILYHGVDAA